MADTRVRKVSVDIVLNPGETVEQALHQVREAWGLKADVLKPTGPAGGNPEVMLEGPVDQLVDVLVKEWNFSYDEAKDYVLSRRDSAAAAATAADDDDAGRDENGKFHPSLSFLDSLRPRENVWSHYRMFRTERVTLDKLADLLQDASDQVDFVEGCDEPPHTAWEPIQVTHVGGRDWVVILGNVGP